MVERPNMSPVRSDESNRTHIGFLYPLGVERPKISVVGSDGSYWTHIGFLFPHPGREA